MKIIPRDNLHQATLEAPSQERWGGTRKTKLKIQFLL